MNTKLLTIFPSLLDKGRTGHVEDLFFDINFHQQFRLFLNCGQVLEGMGMLVTNSAQLGQPGFQWSVVVLCHSSPHPAAVVVSGHDDILHLQHLHCVLNDSQ
jgi:hypothetical protein